MAEGKNPSIPGVIAYFTVSDTKAATAFYERAFGAKLIDRRETPDGRSMHVHVEINGGAMMFNDPFPEHGMGDEPPQNIVLHLVVDDADRWWKRAVDAGVEVTLPLEVAFWGDKYGQVKDPFGESSGVLSARRKVRREMRLTCLRHTCVRARPSPHRLAARTDRPVLRRRGLCRQPGGSG